MEIESGIYVLRTLVKTGNGEIETKYSSTYMLRDLNDFHSARSRWKTDLEDQGHKILKDIIYLRSAAQY